MSATQLHTPESMSANQGKRRRVLMVHSDLVGGGIQKVLIELAAGLPTDRYAKAICYFTTIHPRPPEALLEELKQAGVRLYEVPVFHPFFSMYAWRLKSVIRDFRPDIVHLHAASIGVVGAVVCRRGKIPIVIYTDHILHHENAAWIRALRKVTDRYIDWEVCVSQQARRSLLRAIPARSSCVSVIYNGIQLPEPLSDPERVELRRKLGFSQDSLVVGCVGRLVKIKGYDYLIRAFPLIVEEHPEAVLVLAGSGEYEASLRGLAANCGILDRVKFLGHREDVSRLLGAYDIYVQPSLTEALSISLVEAAGAQKAIVATDVGGNPEVIEHGISGRLVPCRDVEALAKAVCELASDEDQRSEYGLVARERALATFTAEQMVRQYDELYQRLT